MHKNDTSHGSRPLQAGRRRLLMAGTAMAGLGLAGCASIASGPSIGRVVVVGGGFGGATAARYLRLWGGNIDVTLVERNASFVSCPISNLVVGGHRAMADISRPYDSLRALGVKLVQGEAIAVDPVGKTVRLAGGQVLPYDRLILSPGVDFMLDQVGGLAGALDSGRVVHGWKAGPQTVALRKQLTDMADGGVYAITIPKAPYRCPPGPYERACMVASYFKQAKPRSKVLVLDANPEIQSKKALFEKAIAEHYKGIVEYRPNAELKDVAGNTAKLEFEDVQADVLNVVPPQRAADLARSAGLVNVNNRWVGVQWLTMESAVVPGIHVLGDATFSAPLMPKSGHMANQHGKAAAAAIVESLSGRTPQPQMMANTCYSFIDDRNVVHVASVHRYSAEKKTMEAVAGAGGLSSAPNVL